MIKIPALPRWASLLLIALLSAPAWSASAAAEIITGRVVAVADGDTITVLVAGNRQVKIRLADVDTPEKKQPWGKRSKQATSSLVFGRQVTVQVLKKDRYGRSVGRGTVDGKNVGRELVRTGNAWVYRTYSRDPELLALEQQARDQRRGLWALPAAQRVPPWEWRHNKRERAKQARATAAIEHTASRLGIPVRTLQRRFRESGHSYSELVEAVRCRQACRLLGRPGLNTAEVSKALGYADPSSFSRAFRRWTGLSPRDYQRHVPPTAPTQAESGL